MIIKFTHDRKVNLKELRAELGVDFKVLQESCVKVHGDNTVEEVGCEIEIPDDEKAEGIDYQAIAAAHAPEKTDAEEEAEAREAEEDEREGLKLKKRLLKALKNDADFVAKVKKALEIA